PVLTDLWRLVRAPFAPKAVFEEQQAAPTFWMPWIIVSVVFVVLQILQRPFQLRVRDLVLQKMGQPIPPGGVSAVRTVIGFATGALTVLILACIAAGIFYLLLLVFGGQTTFKKMLTVVIFSWPIAILQQVLTYVALSIRGVDSIQSVWDVQVSFGADLLVPSDAALSAFLRLFLAGIGPLAIWQLVITAIGLKTLGKVSTGAAWTAALISFLILLTGLAALGAVGMKAAGG
ncbi:MAG TPA: YIP1 family protein, partial [Gemmatimonadales bacterium]|nr:YIP1 family protein [Gemmatimonadales bacterium]